MKRNSQHGVALIEFALVLPLLLVLTIIVFEFGRGIMYYNALTKSVRDAARYLSMQTPGAMKNEARNLIVYGNTTGSGTPLVPGLTTSMVPDPTWTATSSTPVIQVVTVQVQGYVFTPMWSGLFGPSLTTVTFSNVTASMRSAM